MGIGMGRLVCLCAGLCASFLGMALFRIGSQETAGRSVEEELKKDVNSIPVLNRYCLSRNIWQAVMWVSNLALAVFLSEVYAADVLAVLHMVLLCTVLFVCAWTDCKAYLIPNKILLAGLLFYLALFIAEAFLEPWNIRYVAVSAGVSAAALLLAGMLCRLFAPGSVGFGDLKLFMILGLYLGLGNIWNAVFYTLLLSFVVSVFLLVTKRASRKSVMPFAPFLLFGTLLAVFLHGV